MEDIPLKTITMPYDEFLALEGELKALKANKAQQDKLAAEFLLSMSPEELQAIRSNVNHPLWDGADLQLQQRQANAEISKQQKKGFFK